MKDDFFVNRSLVIASMHEKERVIAPLIESAFGISCEVVQGVNTDLLGTFSGEINRTLDPISAARAKCLMAMEQSGLDLALSSEGSFGAHPEIFFAKANEEIVMLLDAKNGFEVVGRILSTETNFDGREVREWRELVTFAESVHFPSHGLILRDQRDSKKEIIKGIRDWKTLESTFESLMSDYGIAWVETDMRAMHNPTRMQVIQNATLNLIQNIKSLCPACATPGFVVRKTVTGLPCSICSNPTRSVIYLHYSCTKCDFSESRPRIDGKSAEDPMYCDFCNP